MQHFEPLINGKFYHIYNRGINSCDLFRADANYEHFLLLYERFITPVADTYAWCLMKNHFHLLVRIKEDIVYKLSYADRAIDPVRFEKEKWETINQSDAVNPSNLSNADRSCDPVRFEDEKRTTVNHLSNADRSCDPVSFEGEKRTTVNHLSNAERSCDPVRFEDEKRTTVNHLSNAERSCDPVRFEDEKRTTVNHLSNADRSCDPVRFEGEKRTTVNLSESTEERPDSVDPERNTDSVDPKIPKPHLHFSHLFNAYTKYFNKRENRHGSLFERPFKRKLIDNEFYLKQEILYIHNNPVHHGFCSHPLEYPWSSYLSYISTTSSNPKRDEVIGWFGDEANFKFMHNTRIEITNPEEWLEM